MNIQTNENRRQLLNDSTTDNYNNRLQDEQNESDEQTVQSAVIDHIYQKTETVSRSRSLLPQPSDHLVTDLPFLDSNLLPTNQYAGHITASPDGVDDKKLFYWLFEPDLSAYNVGDEKEIPLLIWLNGGPGCSSMDGLFLENGPLRLVKDDNNKSWSIQLNEYSWHKAPAYVLYVDQPVGTGLSFTKQKKYCRNDLEVNIDFHKFLENFLIMYQEFFLVDGEDKAQRSMKRPMYFSGESHAGHYIPSMIDYILQRNDEPNETDAPRVNMNVRGAAIGNGWIDPYYQYAAADLAYSIGMIDAAQKEALDEKEIVCRKGLETGRLRQGVCFDLLDDIIGQSSGRYGKTKMSIYDNRKWEKTNSARAFPPGHKTVEAYLGGLDQQNEGMNIDYKDVLRAIHAEESINAGQRYRECTDPPYNALSHQDGLDVTDEVVRILEHSTKPTLLFFNGMNDMICNHIGNEKLLDNLEWNHAGDWILEKRYAWNFESKFIEGESAVHGPAGYIKSYENLMFLKIASSGHMVPMDLPDTALEMIRNLMHNLSFGDGMQRLDSKLPHELTECSSCPTCMSTPSSVGTESSSGEDDYYGSDDNGEESGLGRVLFTRQFITGGWFGVFVGAGLMFIINIWRTRRTPAFSGKAMSVPSDEDDFEYPDNAETELTCRSPIKGAVEGKFV